MTWTQPLARSNRLREMSRIPGRVQIRKRLTCQHDFNLLLLIVPFVISHCSVCSILSMPNNGFTNILRYYIPHSNRGFARTDADVISFWKQFLLRLSINLFFFPQQVLLPAQTKTGVCICQTRSRWMCCHLNANTIRRAECPLYLVCVWTVGTTKEQIYP